MVLIRIKTAVRFALVWAMCLAMLAGMTPSVRACFLPPDSVAVCAGSCSCGAACKCCLDSGTPREGQPASPALPAPAQGRDGEGFFAILAECITLGRQTRLSFLSSHFGLEPASAHVAIYKRYCSFLI